MTVNETCKVLVRVNNSINAMDLILHSAWKKPVNDEMFYYFHSIQDGLLEKLQNCMRNNILKGKRNAYWL
jgi:hypothetical protein